MSSHVDETRSDRAQGLLGPGGVNGELIGRIAVSIVIQTIILGMLIAGLVVVLLGVQIIRN